MEKMLCKPPSLSLPLNVSLSFSPNICFLAQDEIDDDSFIDDSDAPRFIPAREYRNKAKVSKFFDEEAGVARGSSPI